MAGVTWAFDELRAALSPYIYSDTAGNTYRVVWDDPQENQIPFLKYDLRGNQLGKVNLSINEIQDLRRTGPKALLSPEDLNTLRANDNPRTGTIFERSGPPNRGD